MDIDRSKPVMITGATGYVAGWIVKRLLEEGLTVHAPVRDPDSPDKLKYLDELAEASAGEIRYFKADLLEEGSYAEAMADVRLFFTRPRRSGSGSGTRSGSWWTPRGSARVTSSRRRTGRQACAGWS